MRIVIQGTPAPQGSKNATVINGKAIMWEASAAKLATWRRLIKQACHQAYSEGQTPFTDQAIVVEIIFILPKAKSNRKQHPTAKPDIDKLIRATLDGLTLAKAWNDDAQIVTINATKVFETPDRPAGAEILIEEQGHWGLV